MTLFCCCIPCTHTLGMDHFTISIDMVSFLLNHFVLFNFSTVFFLFSFRFYFSSSLSQCKHVIVHTWILSLLDFQFQFNSWLWVAHTHTYTSTHTCITMLCAQVRTYLSNKYRFFLILFFGYLSRISMVMVSFMGYFYTIHVQHIDFFPFGYFVCTIDDVNWTFQSSWTKALNQSFVLTTSKQNGHNWIFLLFNVSSDSLIGWQ